MGSKLQGVHEGGAIPALLLGGTLTQYAPWPIHLSFWVLFVLLALLLAATWFLPRHAGPQACYRWRPKVPAIPRRLRMAFALAAIPVTTAYTHGVLILSLGGQVAGDLIGSPNALVNGAALSPVNRRAPGTPAPIQQNTLNSLDDQTFRWGPDRRRSGPYPERIL